VGICEVIVRLHGRGISGYSMISMAKALGVDEKIEFN
jgi:hypothetical protein